MARRKSVLGQLGLLASVVVFGYIAISTFLNAVELYKKAQTDLEQEADRQVDELQVSLGLLLWNLDSQAISNILRTKMRDESIEVIRIVDRGRLIHQFIRGENQEIREGNQELATLRVPAKTINRERQLTYNNQSVGRLFLSMGLASRQREVAATIGQHIISQILLFMALMASLFLTWRRVGRRLDAMVAVLAGFSGNQAASRMVPGRDDELGYLARGFNSMADRVFASTLSMEAEIRDRTDRLVESEKLAVIGSLVAGVAHEINTPVGNCITVASWLGTRVQTVQGQATAGCLDESVMVKFLDDAKESVRIIETSLARTANLILAFKKIGADQLADVHTRIRLSDFLTDLSLSLQPTYKRHPQKMAIDCPLDIELETAPGALYQVVSNLVINAYTHAYPDNRTGTILVRGFCDLNQPNLIHIEVRDDGIGMDQATRDQIFLPFFTTRRHLGGTGLGLAIVWNLVKGLGGNIVVETAIGKGTSFLVDLPCNDCRI